MIVKDLPVFSFCLSYYLKVKGGRIAMIAAAKASLFDFMSCRIYIVSIKNGSRSGIRTHR